ncbi:MAG: hypothetical protein JSV76_06715 [Candidatus Bathyarchaeota archaeon]|nr:MAG: hypothetical protein JSV76_06715 [Candidatus Bathyarchaeota archaeon]
MLKAIEMIRIAESVASEIQDEAKLHAKRIQQETEEKLGEVYKEAYVEVLTEAEHRSTELMNESNEAAEREGNDILRKMDKEIEKIREKARKSFKLAVDSIANELIL